MSVQLGKRRKKTDQIGLKMFLLLVVNSVQAVMLCHQLKVVSSSHRKMGGGYTLKQTTLLNYMLYAAFVTHRTGCWSSVSVFSSFFLNTRK